MNLMKSWAVMEVLTNREKTTLKVRSYPENLRKHHVGRCQQNAVKKFPADPLVKGADNGH